MFSGKTHPIPAVNKKSNPPSSVSIPADDALLWQKFRGGCHASFSLLYHRHAAALYQYGTKLTACPEEVEDSIHDLFVELWEHKEHLRSPSSVIFYLLKALKHKIIQIRRKQDNVKRLPVEALTSAPAEVLSENEGYQEMRRTLARAIEKLSPRQQEVVFLLFYEGMSHQEVAQIMDISYQGVANLVCRTMKALRQQVSSKVSLGKQEIASIILLFLACF